MALLVLPSTSPGWYKYLTLTRGGIRSGILCWRFWGDCRFFDCNSRPFTNEPINFIAQCPKNFGKPFDPSSRSLALRQKHFNSIVMAKQALSKRTVETLDNGFVSGNFSVTAANICFVTFHFLGHASHELAARVNLQHQRPSQGTASVNLATSAESFEVRGSASL